MTKAYNPFAGFTDNEDEAIATGIGARKVVAGEIPPITEIPIIDLAGAFSDNLDERRKVAQEIYVACSQIGFFYVKNHGVDLDLIKRCQKAGLGFFQDLSHEQKMELSMAKNRTEYYGYAPRAITMPNGAIKRRKSFCHTLSASIANSL
jgi:isopenicillin N synthase-like dioxygenase